MSSIKHSTRVTICGEDYTIRSDSPPDHTRRVAAYVDAKIREVLESASGCDAPGSPALPRAPANQS